MFELQNFVNSPWCPLSAGIMYEEPAYSALGASLPEASSTVPGLLTHALWWCGSSSEPHPPRSLSSRLQTRDYHVRPLWSLAAGSQLEWLTETGVDISKAILSTRSELLRHTLTVVIVVEIHGEVDVVWEHVQILYEQKELPDEQHCGSLGILQRHVHCQVVVPAIMQRRAPVSMRPRSKKATTNNLCTNLKMSICGPMLVYLNLKW